MVVQLVTAGLRDVALRPCPGLTLRNLRRCQDRVQARPALPLLVSWGVASTTCHPSKPEGRSGLFIQQSFHTWKFLEGVWRELWASVSHSGPPPPAPTPNTARHQASGHLQDKWQATPHPVLTRQNRGSDAQVASCFHRSRCP